VILNRSQEILRGDVNSRLRETARRALDSRAVPVESELGYQLKRFAQVEYKRQNEAETLEAATIVWTAGNALHPLIKVPTENRDRGSDLGHQPAIT